MHGYSVVFFLFCFCFYCSLYRNWLKKKATPTDALLLYVYVIFAFSRQWTSFNQQDLFTVFINQSVANENSAYRALAVLGVTNTNIQIQIPIKNKVGKKKGKLVFKFLQIPRSGFYCNLPFQCFFLPPPFITSV